MVRRRPGQILPLELEILDAGMSLQAQEGSFYGFLLAKQIAEQTEGSLLAHGTLYKALARMASAGLIEAEWEDAALAEHAGRPRRRLYHVTGEGELASSREHRRLADEARQAPVLGLGRA